MEKIKVFLSIYSNEEASGGDDDSGSTRDTESCIEGAPRTIGKERNDEGTKYAGVVAETNSDRGAGETEGDHGTEGIEEAFVSIRDCIN